METVTLVGAGIVNLVTALELVRGGYDVAVYDRAPDPRAGEHWTAYGCTRGGGDGRMFTLTEADSYNSRSLNPDGTPGNLLTRPVSDDGWRIAKPGSLTQGELAWADSFHRLPRSLARQYNDDIFAVNAAAQPLWEGLMSSSPELFSAETGYADGILRLYTDAADFWAHLARNERAGAVRRQLSGARVAIHHPALAPASANGVIAGAIEVIGFTVNIHKFVARLVDLLEPGVKFHWNAPVSRIRWQDQATTDQPAQDQAAKVADGLELATGEVVRSKHYVLSPGAYGAGLLEGTAAAGLIQGMLGVWLTVPNLEPRLRHSLKIARPGHRAEETNVTLGVAADGSPVLLCGSGYGWTGRDPSNVDAAELSALYDSLEDTVRKFFPRAYLQARNSGALDQSRRLCVRPWTPTCLGVFERIASADGGELIVTGGHNTGGFAQSPVVAEAVLAALGGREHMMHSRYDPRRHGGRVITEGPADPGAADSTTGSASLRNT